MTEKKLTNESKNKRSLYTMLTSLDKFHCCFFPNPSVCAGYYDNFAINSTSTFIHRSITEPPENVVKISIILLICAT